MLGTSIFAMPQETYVEVYGGNDQWVPEQAGLSLADVDNTLGLVLEEADKLRAQDLLQGAVFTALTKALRLTEEVANDILQPDFNFKRFNNEALSGLKEKLNQALAELRTAIAA